MLEHVLLKHFSPEGSGREPNGSSRRGERSIILRERKESPHDSLKIKKNSKEINKS